MDGPVKRGSPVLDFGCGSGDMVRDLGAMGLDAAGCDLQFKDGRCLDGLRLEGRVRPIDPDPYHLPFDDNTFEVVVSDQVLEHVSDLDSAVRELDRVLGPGGVTLHIFPARYAPVEPHTCVPGATVCQQRFWLEAWARLGVRNRFQSGDPATVVARKNREYLLSCTNYRTKREIRAAFGRVFARVDFCEREFLECGQGAGQPRRALAAIPGVPELYSAVRGRVLFTKKAPLDADRTR